MPRISKRTKDHEFGGNGKLVTFEHKMTEMKVQNLSTSTVGCVLGDRTRSKNLLFLKGIISLL